MWLPIPGRFHGDRRERGILSAWNWQRWGMDLYVTSNGGRAWRFFSYPPRCRVTKGADRFSNPPLLFCRVDGFGTIFDSELLDGGG